jgi:DNA-binding transcriptional regulator/RsmH inhibitor MraZ
MGCHPVAVITLHVFKRRCSIHLDSCITTTTTTTAIELSLGGSNPYTTTDKQTRINIRKQLIEKRSTNNKIRTQ